MIDVQAPNSGTSSNNNSVGAAALAESRLRSPWSVAAILALAICIVYWPALGAPFIADDTETIVTNESIVHLWPLFGSAEQPGPLRPRVPLPTAGRPLVNLSFALNYYFVALAPTGYHVVNVLIHLGSSLLVWTIVRRTLRLPYFANRFDSSADWLALAVALIWRYIPCKPSRSSTLRSGRN